MNKEYTNPTIEIIEFNMEDILTASFGGVLPGDNEEDYGGFWE